jgi:putative transcriptional regulator
MIKHHPDSRILNEFSSGSLPLAQSVCVSAHLAFCEHCKRQHQSLQELGAAMFDKLAPAQVDDSLLAGILDRLDDPAPLEFEQAATAADESPALIQRLVSRDFADLEWQRMGSALQISHLKTGDPWHETSLYHIKAGGSVPRHTHRGTELALVLEGSFSDEEGVYQQGDFMLRDTAHVHTPTATQTADCICIGVLDAPIKFTAWNYRVLNPFLKLHAQ